MRGRAVAGFEQPGSMRLEGVAPFGQPAFILAATSDSSILLLPRDERVLQGARVEEVLGALTGVALGPADLQAILTGCVQPDPVPDEARVHRDGWASIDLAGGATILLRMQDGAWQLRAARRDAWDVEYLDWLGRFPRTVRLLSRSPDLAVDLTATLSQLEVNIDIDPAAFTAIVPVGSVPLSIEELRDAGPLRNAP